MPISLAVAGAAGRMGQRVIALAAADSRFELAAAFDCAGSGRLGADAGETAGIGRSGVPIAARSDSPFDVLIDFSTAGATLEWVHLCLGRQRAIVIGATGHTAAQSAEIDAAAHRIALLKSANMSVGVNMLLGLVEQLAAGLGVDYDVEIVETHHRFKLDAPSGTALALKDAVLRGRRGAPTEVVFGREGHGPPRPPGQIGIHAVRAGDVVGEHDVRFSTAGETLLVRHVAHSRDTFARGALAAAAWIAGKPAGRYSMADVLAGSATSGGV